MIISERSNDEESPSVRHRHQDGKMKYLQNKILCGAAVVLGIATVVIIIVSAAKTSPTAGESLMLGVLISVFSVLAAVLVSHIYYNLSSQSASEDAKKSYDEKIRTFARKAAEKVFNLSNEFDRLAESLRTSIDDSEEEDSNKITILVLREKMLAAIHILETLKSMNDTSLSDWQGIIGEDIQLQRKLQREIGEELEEQRQLIAKLQLRVGDDGSEAVEDRVQEIERRLLEKIAALPFSFRPVRVKPKKQEVQIVCPGCKISNTTRVHARAGATKLFQCSGCKHFVSARYQSETEYRAEMAAEKHIDVACGVCRGPVSFSIPDRLGASIHVVCPTCSCGMMAAITKEGIRYRGFDNKVMSQKFLEMVLANIPPKPWPQGMHKQVAEKMGVSHTTIDRAIGALIKVGRLEPSGPDPHQSPTGNGTSRPNPENN